jgi:hypothetical protein
MASEDDIQKRGWYGTATAAERSSTDLKYAADTWPMHESLSIRGLLYVGVCLGGISKCLGGISTAHGIAPPIATAFVNRLDEFASKQDDMENMMPLAPLPSQVTQHQSVILLLVP